MKAAGDKKHFFRSLCWMLSCSISRGTHLHVEDMEGLMSSFADGEWDSCDSNFLNDDADFILRQLFSNEVVEGSSSSSVAPSSWSFLENDVNLTEARQSFFHPVGSCDTDTNQNHILTQYGFSDHREFGMFPQQLSNSNVPLEYYTTDVVASPVTFFSNTIPEVSPFMSVLEMSRVEPDTLSSIPNKPLNLKRNLDVCTLEVPNKAMKNDCGSKTKTLPKKNRKTLTNSFDLEAKQMSTSSYSSEDDSNSNASPEVNARTSSDTKLVTSNDINGKKKGRRGTAIDPQSLYARKRRDRINERLRILQNLVPNGTKVDISTMLEEAVSYVKFLQTQIKLLSSDDLWMYAPIAYNGVDVGLDRRLSQNL